MQGDLRKTVYKMIRIVYNTYVAMKSGLKALNKYHIFNLFLVTLPTAMKSGLKDVCKMRCRIRLPGYTPYRDEKRTESTMCLSLCFIV